MLRWQHTSLLWFTAAEKCFQMRLNIHGCTGVCLLHSCLLHSASFKRALMTFRFGQLKGKNIVNMNWKSAVQADSLCPYACIVIQRKSQLALTNATQIAHQTAKSSALISRNQEGEKVQHKKCWRVHTQRNKKEEQRRVREEGKAVLCQSNLVTQGWKCSVWSLWI